MTVHILRELVVNAPADAGHPLLYTLKHSLPLRSTKLLLQAPSYDADYGRRNGAFNPLTLPSDDPLLDRVQSLLPTPDTIADILLSECGGSP